MIKKTAYTELTTTMSKLGAQISAAEAHGLLVGILCLSPAMPATQWQTVLLENLDCNQPTKKDWGIFDKLVSKIVADFNKQSFTVKILLPDDEDDLAERLTALGDWCRGCLLGLALVGITAKDLGNKIVNELVQDLSQIANVDYKTEASEEAEHNYMELVEYVRIAVQNIQSELHDESQRDILH